MPFNTIRGFVKAESLGFNTGIASILDRLRVNENECRPFSFFDVFSRLTMKRGHDQVKDAFFSPMLVVPKYRGIRREVFWQVNPVATIFELIQNAIDNLSFTPFGRTSPLFLGQQRLNDFPFSICQTAGVWHLQPV